MKNNKTEYYPVNLHILTPVHVGSGFEMDPFDYVIRDEVLHIINLTDWIDQFPDKELLLSIMDTDNFSSVRSFIAKNFDASRSLMTTIPVKTQKLIKDYNKAVNEQNSRNQVLVDSMTRNQIDGIPYLPGSSIKGAIRTAVGNQFVSVANVTSRDRSNYNKKIFGPPGKDPMKNLKTADVSLSRYGTFIYEAREYTNNPDKSLTPKGFKEASASLSDMDEPVIYKTRLSLGSLELTGQQVDIQFLIQALNSFYIPK